MTCRIEAVARTPHPFALRVSPIDFMKPFREAPSNLLLPAPPPPPRSLIVGSNQLSHVLHSSPAYVSTSTADGPGFPWTLNKRMAIKDALISMQSAQPERTGSSRELYQEWLAHCDPSGPNWAIAKGFFFFSRQTSRYYHISEKKLQQSWCTVCGLQSPSFFPRVHTCYASPVLG